MPRKSWLTIVAISSGSRRSRKTTVGAVAERAALRGQQLADELVVGHVAAEGVAEPGVEVVNRLDADAVRIRPQQVGPLVRPVVGILGPLQQAIDQLRSLVRRSVGKERPCFIRRRQPADHVEVRSAQERRVAGAAPTA